MWGSCGQRHRADADRRESLIEKTRNDALIMKRRVEELQAQVAVSGAGKAAASETREKGCEWRHTWRCIVKRQEDALRRN